MTILETERLSRAISDLLQNVSNPELASKLADDYAAACHDVNLRLQKCEAMIKSGDKQQSLQLAEATPNLLDLISVLEFRGADDWRRFCKRSGLTAAQTIEAHATRALNECYAEGIAFDHPFYVTYRETVLLHKDEEALKVLQSIVRLNPDDDNAASELNRLDVKVLGSQLELLGVLLIGGDTQLIIAAMEVIESFGFKTQPRGKAWREAKGLYCGCLLNEVVKFKTSSQWMDAMATLDNIQRIQTELKLDFSPPFIQQMKSLQVWTEGEQAKYKTNREFSALVSKLHYSVQQSEAKDTSARFVELRELRDDFEALHKNWAALTNFDRPISEDTTAAFRKRSALLEGEIARRMAARRRTIILGSAAALLVCGIAVWLVLGQMKAREFATQLEKTVSQRQARATELLLERIRTRESRLLSVGRVTTAVANAESFITKERGLVANFEAAFRKLPTQLSGELNTVRLKRLADQLTSTRAALDALGSDGKTENEPRVQSFEKEWQRFLSEAGVSLNKLFEQWVVDAEGQCAKLDYRAPVNLAGSQLTTLSGLIQKLNDYETGFTNHVKFRSDLHLRAAAARSKFKAFDQEFQKLGDGLALLKKSRAIPSFLEAISKMASSEFSSSPAAVAATSIQSLALSDEATIRPLLDATNEVTWEFISKQKATSLIPQTVVPAEDALLQQLKKDPAINASHHKYRLWLGSQNQGQTSVEWITAGELQSSQGWTNIKAWTTSGTSADVKFEQMSYGCFSGKWRLPENIIVARLDHVESLSEASAFGATGLGKGFLFGNTYEKPALEILDAIKNSREGSPLFRAYLFCSVVELMGFQPDAWGLSFCRSVSAQVIEIKRIVGGQISVGDWFIPSREKAWASQLEQLFVGMKAVSYAKQANVNLSLARAAAKDGLRLVGFVGLDGKPVFTGDTPTDGVWGYDTLLRQPSLVSSSTMLLSPLFALNAPRSEYLSKAGYNKNAVSITTDLAPLFR